MTLDKDLKARSTKLARSKNMDLSPLVEKLLAEWYEENAPRKPRSK